MRALNTGGGLATKTVAAQQFYDEEGSVCEAPRENATAAAANFTKAHITTRGRPEGAQAALVKRQQREARADLDFIILPMEPAAVLVKAKKNKATSNGVAVRLLEVCMASPKAFGLLQKLVSGISEEGRAAPARMPATTPQPPTAPDPTAPVLTARALIDVAKNPGRTPSALRRVLRGHHLRGGLVAQSQPRRLPNDLSKGYLQVFPRSLRVAEYVAVEPGGSVDAAAELELEPELINPYHTKASAAG